MPFKQTALYHLHQQLEAKLVPFAGYEMPIQYKSVKQECLAVRTDCGMFDVSHMGEFLVEGPQAIDFMDFVVTNDIKSAKINKAVYSPLCREDGTVIDDLIVYLLKPDKLLICVNAANIQKDWNWLLDISQSYDVSLTDISEKTSLIAVQGPKAELAMKALNLLPSDNFEYYSATQINDLIIARTGYTGEDGFEIFGPNELICRIWEQLLDQEVIPCGLASRDVLRLEVCYPLYGQEIFDEVTPLDSSLKWTVKFAKENFIGKAALKDYQPKYRLVKLIAASGIPRKGYIVTDSKGQSIGTITSGTMSVSLNKGIALAHIEIDKYPDDKKFFIQIRNNSVATEISKKPFVKGGHK